MLDPELAKRIDDGIDQRRRGADRTGLAGPLTPSGLVRHGTTLKSNSIAGRSSARGRQ
jgi:hypothetical protein